MLDSPKLGGGAFPQTPAMEWVCEFYTNQSVISLKNSMMTIRGKQVNIGTKRINEMYGILNANTDNFHAKSCQPGTWMENILCPGKEVPWATIKRDIHMNDFTVEVRLYLNIICS
ncbi:hypothetical protein FXO38_07906 [Capsicum annuum]|nr:hypothetical protein FXO38_07906 [Capsicum annuum]KAF3670994.1 hypothetical protein FXO37_08261 [Capsicum annuum]